jgi:hypothetical protein
MMIDEPKGGQYDTGFERCAEGWRLWNLAYIGWSELCGSNGEPSRVEKYMAANEKYNQHVRDCPECLAVKGRFAEAE